MENSNYGVFSSSMGFTTALATCESCLIISILLDVKQTQIYNNESRKIIRNTAAIFCSHMCIKRKCETLKSAMKHKIKHSSNRVKK
jgi:glutathionyl-hydroquinone reductase